MHVVLFQEVHPQLEQAIMRLINSADVVLFMKGSPSAPRCGFSKSAAELLAQNQVHFCSFDILLDAKIREGLKLVSKWPTFPQLYVHGQLVGGVDIMRELASQGELRSLCCD